MCKHGEVMRNIGKNYYRATQHKGIKVAEYIDSKTRKANEIGARKPYEVCNGTLISEED